MPPEGTEGLKCVISVYWKKKKKKNFQQKTLGAIRLEHFQVES